MRLRRKVSSRDFGVFDQALTNSLTLSLTWKGSNIDQRSLDRGDVIKEKAAKWHTSLQLSLMSIFICAD